MCLGDSATDEEHGDKHSSSILAVRAVNQQLRASLELGQGQLERVAELGRVLILQQRGHDGHGGGLGF